MILRNITWTAIAISLMINVVAMAWVFSQYEKVQILENDLVALTELPEYQKAENGNEIAVVHSLVLKNANMLKLFPVLMEDVKNLKVKLSRIQSVTKTVITGEKRIVTSLRDSVLHDTVIVRVFNYSDDYYKIKGVATADSQMVEISSIDSLNQIVYYGKRPKPWLWFFSKRQLMQKIESKNPNTRIIYSQHIQIQN